MKKRHIVIYMDYAITRTNTTVRGWYIVGIGPAKTLDDARQKIRDAWWSTTERRLRVKPT